MSIVDPHPRGSDRLRGPWSTLPRFPNNAHPPHLRMVCRMKHDTVHGYLNTTSQTPSNIRDRWDATDYKGTRRHAATSDTDGGEQ